MEDSDRIVAAIYAASSCQAHNRHSADEFLAYYDELIKKMSSRAQHEHWQSIPG
jgi:hypothetical protein